jgi:hypothetical protein
MVSIGNNVFSFTPPSTTTVFSSNNIKLYHSTLKMEISENDWIRNSDMLIFEIEGEKFCFMKLKGGKNESNNI